MLQRGDSGSGIGQRFSLSDLYDFGPRGPEVGQSEDDICPSKDLFQCFVAVVEVCGLNVDSFCGESQGSRLGDIASEPSYAILVGILEKLFDNGSPPF